MTPSDMDNSSFAPARRTAAVTPHAADPLPGGACDFIFVGTGGTVVCRAIGDSADVTWKVPAGGYVWAKITHVRATSTAADMVAGYTKRA